MKILQKQPRPLDVKESKSLMKIRSTAQRALHRGFKWPQLLAAIALGLTSFYFAIETEYDLVTFALGTLSVFCVAFLVILPYEYFMERARAKDTIRRATDILNAGMVEVASVRAKQIAIAKEYKDEGDLYIIEMDNSSLLYVWDEANNLKKNFPCLEFEIYDRKFFELIGRQINPLGEKIKPVVIDPASKNRYFKKAGVPEHLAIDRKNFAKLVERITNA